MTAAMTTPSRSKVRHTPNAALPPADMPPLDVLASGLATVLSWFVDMVPSSAAGVVNWFPEGVLPGFLVVGVVSWFVGSVVPWTAVGEVPWLAAGVGPGFVVEDEVRSSGVEL